MKRSLTHIICSFVLLFAQQAALAHAAWHAHADAPAQHEDHGDGSFQGELCGLHGAFTQVLGGIQTPEVRPARSPRAAHTIAHRCDAQVVPELHLPLSRGPPSFS